MRTSLWYRVYWEEFDGIAMRFIEEYTQSVRAANKLLRNNATHNAKMSLVYR